MSSQVWTKEILEIEKQQVHGEGLTIFFILHAPSYPSFPTSVACCENVLPSACKKVGIWTLEEVFIEMKMHVLQIL